jgi:hypothetical protein
MGARSLISVLGALPEMAIDLSPHQIDVALARASGGLRQYEWLQSRVAGQNDFEQDPEFRRGFNRFYRVRRGREWQDTFYGLMGRAKKEGLEFRAVLHALHSATNRYEASFASKLVATLDPSKPVIDAFVLRNVGLRLPTYAAADRAGRIGEIYGELISAFSTFLSGERGCYLISAFRRTYPDARITNVKMLDLVLWQTRPPRCRSCGGRHVAELLYGLPAVDEELNRNLRAGHIVLGGCCVSERMPQWRCGTCSHEWG